MFPQIDKPFVCIDIYNRKAPVALWVHPLTQSLSHSLTHSTSKPSPCHEALPHAAMKWLIFLRFWASRCIAHHHIWLQVSPLKSWQCGKSTTHDGIFSYSPAMFIAEMVIRNIQLTILLHIPQESSLNHHHNAGNRLKIGYNKMAELFLNPEQKFQHVGKCIAAQRMRFWCIAWALERPIVGVQHHNVWLGL